MNLNKLSSIVSSNPTEPQSVPDKKRLAKLSFKFALAGALILFLGIAILVLYQSALYQSPNGPGFINSYLPFGTLLGSSICGLIAMVLAVKSLWKWRLEKGWGYSVSGLILGSLPLFLVIFLVVSLMNLTTNYLPHRPLQAMVGSANAEMKAMADAERQAEIDTGYYVTLRTLDDNPGVGVDSTGNIIQFYIESEPLPFAIDTDFSFYTGNQFPYVNWKGPYINFQSIILTGNPNQPSEYGSPLDPWGHPYKLYTHKILTNPASGDQLTSPFDREAIVSYGSDGLPGNQGKTLVGTGDDLVYQF